MTRNEALKLCIDGIRVQPRTISNPENHMYFDGTKFMYHTPFVDKEAIAVLSQDHWKIYEEPKPEPMFSIGEFVIEGDGFYARVESMEYIDGQWVYETKHHIDESGEHFAESKLSKV